MSGLLSSITALIELEEKAQKRITELEADRDVLIQFIRFSTYHFTAEDHSRLRRLLGEDTDNE